MKEFCLIFISGFWHDQNTQIRHDQIWHDQNICWPRLNLGALTSPAHEYTWNENMHNNQVYACGCEVNSSSSSCINPR